MIGAYASVSHPPAKWISSMRAAMAFLLFGVGGALMVPGSAVYDLVALAGGGVAAGGIFALVFHLGAWPIIYAATMWLSLLTGPTMTGVDPTQQRLMRWMPWVFMFVLAQSAVGLVIYWSFSSIFTMAQQYVLMRRFKVENPLDAFVGRMMAGRTAAKDAKAAE